MNNENTFNKEYFSELLDRAKGERSINRYAEETGVSAAHISRFLRNMIDAPPAPETISKLSSKAHNNISYRDLMEAAGHIALADKNSSVELEEFEEIDSDNRESTRRNHPTPRNGFIDQLSPNERRTEVMNLEKKIFQIMLSYLYEVDFKWNMQKPDSKTRFPDMIVDIEDNKYSRWLIEFKASPESYRGLAQPLQYIYGMIATRELYNNDKFTIVLNNKRAYDMFFRRPPLSLRANIYVMLVDIEKGIVKKEEKLCSYEA